MKKILLFVMLVTMTFGANAQTSEYREKTKALIDAGFGNYKGDSYKDILKNMMGGALSGLGQQLGGDDSDMSASLVNSMIDEVITPYFEEDFSTDVVDALTPAMEKEFTLDEMDELLSLYQSDSVQAFTNKSEKVAVGGIQGMIAQLTPSLMKIAMGQDVDPIEKVDCPADYREAFNSYFQAVAGKQLEQLEQNATGVTADAGVHNYIKENLSELMLGMCYPTLSKEDLAFGARLAQNQLMNRASSLSSTIAENSNMQKHLSSRLMKWVMGHMGSLGE